MTTEGLDLARLAETVEALRREVARLAERVAALEAAAVPAARVTASPPAAEPVSEELIVVLGAAVAAYLGQKVPIRQIRLLGSPAWRRQSRVTIQASHERVLSRPGR
jgi:methylmalonyl-CoA carboxyltransferase large subunit